MATEPCQFVTRAGEKLDAGLKAFGIDVAGAVCADFGANVGGFTDCLLRRGAAKVYAVDTGYGELAWRLRTDRRVVVMERTNALHCPVPATVDLVTVDVAWTPQELIVPAASRWLAPARAGRRIGIVALLKPHYELARRQRHRPHDRLSGPEADAVCLRVCRRLTELGWLIRAQMRSVLRGKGGNVEFLLWIDGASDCRQDVPGGRQIPGNELIDPAGG